VEAVCGIDVVYTPLITEDAMTWEEAGLISDDTKIMETLRWAASRNVKVQVLQTIKHRLETKEVDHEDVRMYLNSFVAGQL
jgi:hypothetical protein